MAYATDTNVPVEKTRAEIERLLSKYGASRFAYMTDDHSAVIGFGMKGKMIKFVLPLPDRADRQFWRTPARGYQRNETEAYKAWEQACRSRWRALQLCIKAKLEAIECKITTFEHEFLAHIVVGNGMTAGDVLIPQIEEAATSGRMPILALEFGGSR